MLNSTIARLLAPGFLVLLGACIPGPDDVTFEICGDVVVPTEIDAVRVTMLDSNREATLREGVRELVDCGPESYRSLPQTVTFESPEQESWVIVRGLSEGVTRMSFETRIADPDDARVRISMTRDCLGISCPLGLTCVQGTCVEVEHGLEAGCSSAESLDAPAPEPEDNSTEYCPDDDAEEDEPEGEGNEEDA